MLFFIALDVDFPTFRGGFNDYRGLEAKVHQIQISILLILKTIINQRCLQRLEFSMNPKREDVYRSAGRVIGRVDDVLKVLAS